MMILLSGLSLSAQPPTRRENLGPNVNSPYEEISPVFSADGKTLYFSRRNCPTNIGDPARDDIYISTFSANGWTRAKNIGPPLNTDDFNDVAAVSSDGNTLLLYNVYNLDGTLERGFSMTRREGTSWSVPEKIFIHDFARYARSQSIEATLSSDGSVLIMTLTDNASFGDKNIYVSFLLDAARSEWTAPRTLGPVVNSPYGEHSPVLASDGLTLYFASTRPGGQGEADMYVTHRLDSSWSEWSAPENLGPSVNGAGFDAYYTIPAEGKYAYFVSDARGGYGKFDIYRIALPENLRPEVVALVKTVYFTTNHYDIAANFSPSLETLAAFLRDHPGSKARITGHTDNVGSSMSNEELATKRANVVAKYLLSHGVRPAQLRIEGRGKREPRASNRTNEGRAQNRRVEIMVY